MRRLFAGVLAATVVALGGVAAMSAPQPSEAPTTQAKGGFEWDARLGHP